MKLSRVRLSVLLSILLMAVSGAPIMSFAQYTVGGGASAIVRSTWTNGPVSLTPPGDGGGQGRVRVGLWPAESAIVGAPPYSNATPVATPLPISWGTSYPYTVAGVPVGDYVAVAWVDGDAAGDYDPGEPRSPATAVAVTNNITGPNLIVVDDSDGDGVTDWWEAHWFGDLAQSGGDDYDKDGLSNQQEFDYATQAGLVSLCPTNWDSDGDLMDDGWEYANYCNGFGTDPTISDATVDPDGDGLINAQEYRGVDGYPIREQDPTKVRGIARLNTTQDTGDVLSPVDVDTDGDMLIDSFEAAWYDPSGGIDPKAAGSSTADPDQDGLSNYREQCLLTNLVQGAAEDIWSDPVSAFPVEDGDGVTAFAMPILLGGSLSTIFADRASLRGHAWTDPTAGTGFAETLQDGQDTDNDLLPDGWEVEYNLNPRSSAGANGRLGDPDADGLKNYQEYLGQDGERIDARSGSGDETNPKTHNWRPDSTGAGDGASRDHTLGAALPTLSLGADAGLDTDDDGHPDTNEIRRQYSIGIPGSSPVHSLDPFVKGSALLTSNDGIPLPDPESTFHAFTGLRNWTVECYVKIMSSGRSGYLVNCTNTDVASDLPSGLVGFRLELDNDVPKVSFDTIAGVRYQVSGLAIPTNQWIHIAGVWNTDFNSLSLYMDGIFAQKQEISEESSSADARYHPWVPRIGLSANGTFANRIYFDEVRIWGKARSAEEIEQYRTKLVPQDTPHLLAYYRFDDGGTSAEDFVRKAKNGLLGAVSHDYLHGDFGYALPTNNFFFVTNTLASINGAANVRGVDKRGADDSDGDGMPDGWELSHRLDPFSAVGSEGAAGDPDTDGLNNLYEFWCGTNPRDEDTDQDATLDRIEDRDGDGVVNGTESSLGSRPDIVDTDDDGRSDNEEQAAGTSPVNPIDPAVARSMWFGGSSNDYLLVPNALKQRLTDWTLEAWVNPTNASTGAGYIIRRVVETPVSGSKGVNFVLGIETNAGGLRPYGGYVFANGTNYMVRGNNIPAGTWTHIAVSYDNLSAKLTIYTSGVPVGTMSGAHLAPPINGKGGETSLRIGEDFGGMIDEVRIWNDVRTSAEMLNKFDEAVPTDSPGLIHYFQFDDGQAVTNATFPAWTGYHQPHGAQDFVYSQDWNEEWAHAARLNGAVAFTLGGGIGVPPSITVILEPSPARDAGAQWSLDGGPWNDSGSMVISFAGAHGIVYKPLPGWTAPTYEPVTLIENQARTLTRIYTNCGSLRITLQTSNGNPLPAGAGWTVGGGAINDSGVVVSNLSPGSHNVSYAPVANWVEPASEGVLINEGLETTLVRQYYPVLGNLRVFIDPAIVITNGGQWRIDSGVWRDSGTMVSGLNVGSHTLEFSDVIPWISPSNQIVQVVDTSTVVITGRYTQVTGIQVLLHPAAAITAGAQWRVGSGAWQDSGDLMSVSPGSHVVEFKEVSGWVAPSSWTVAVAADVISLVDATYYNMEVYGSSGTGVSQFRGPKGIAIRNRNLFVADSGNNRIQVIDTLTGLWTPVGSYGTRAGQFNQPLGVALDPSGNLWVADANNHRIQVLTADGAWTAFGSRGTGLGQFNVPFDLEADSGGNVYVVDHYNHRVQKRATSGAWSVVIDNGAADGFVRYPNGIAIDGWDNIYVSDRDPVSGLGRIQKFDENGLFLGRVGSSLSAGGGFGRPRGIAAGLSTNIYVADTDNNQVQELMPAGWSVLMNSLFLTAPEDVAVDQFGNVFIADTGKDRVLRLSIEDTDDDDLPDWVENGSGVYSNAFNTGTIWTNSDSDGDGYGDGRELRVGTNYPNNPLLMPHETVNDYDGDGMSDIAVYYASSGGWRIRQSTDWAIYGGAPLYWGWSAAKAVAGDYDGDGMSDIAVYWPGGGNWYIRYSGGGSLTQPWGWSAATAVPGDYDGDGKTDIAVYHAAGGTWYIRYSGGGSLTQPWGWSAAMPVPGDYDGDGKTDIAVYHAAGGTWYIRHSGGGSLIQPWGWGAAVPVPGDYDGDGLTDIAVYHAAGGKWYIRYSSGGSATIAWGWSAAKAVPGDYDGDGRTDIAVYSEAGGTWFVRASSGGGGQLLWGGSGAAPVTSP